MKKGITIILAVLVIVLLAVLLLHGGNSPATESERSSEEAAAGNTAKQETEGTAAEAITEPAEADSAEDTAAKPTEKQTDRTGTGTPGKETAKESSGKEEKEQPFLVQITEDDISSAYVLIRMPNPIGFLPLPPDGEYNKTIRQKNPDGSEYVNILHLNPNGFYMEDANCEGHDCVNQGEVTLENREERILWNMVICLPHQLSAELITREEAEQMLK